MTQHRVIAVLVSFAVLAGSLALASGPANAAVIDNRTNASTAPSKEGEPLNLPLTGALAQIISAPGHIGSSGGYAPEWTVGLGWGVYLYLNPGDVNWLVGIGSTAASTVVCGWLTGTVAGAVACGVGWQVVWSIINNYYQVIPSGYCLEIKFAGTITGKLVKRNC